MFDLARELLEQKQCNRGKVANVQSLLGSALLGQKKYADAEPLLLAGYDGLKKDEKAIPPQGKSNLLERCNASWTSTTSPAKRTKPRNGERMEALKTASEP